MKKVDDLLLELDNGDTDTITHEDINASQYFWSDCFSHCFQEMKTEIHYNNNVDLMGNFIDEKTL